MDSELDEFCRRAPDKTRQHWEEFLLPDRELLGNALNQVAIDRISEVLSVFTEAPRRTSLYFPFKYDITLLSKFYTELRDAAEAASASRISQLLENVPDRENRLLTELVNFELPGLADLSPEDMVAIRQGEAFEEWRNGL